MKCCRVRRWEHWTRRSRRRSRVTITSAWCVTFLRNRWNVSTQRWNSTWQPLPLPTRRSHSGDISVIILVVWCWLFINSRGISDPWCGRLNSGCEWNDWQQQQENVAVVNALQLEAARCHASRSGLFVAKSLLRMHTNCYFAASDQKFWQRH